MQKACSMDISSVSYLNLFWIIARNGIAVLYRSSIFNILKNFHTFFFSGCYQNILPMTGHNGSFLSTFSTLITFCLLDDSILTWMRWFAILVLICNTLIISNIEHLFYVPDALHIYSLGKLDSGLLFKFNWSNFLY